MTRGARRPARSPSTSPPAGWPGARSSSTASTASRTASGRPRATSGKRVVEWDVVHAATSPLPPAEPPADVYFDARATWVARRAGEPRPLDEDLALAFLAGAGIGPEQTLGIARHCTIDPYGSSDTQQYLWARVDGVHVFVPGRPVAPTTQLEVAPPAGICVELLNWDAIAAVVHPVRQQRPHLPSRFPYLPLTAQELLRAYLGIVGVAPQDSYGVQVTYDRRLDLMGRSSTSSHVRKTTGGDELPCADGKPRVRMHGGAQLVSPTATARPTPRAARAGPPTRRRSCRPSCRAAPSRAARCTPRVGSPRAPSTEWLTWRGLRSRRSHDPGPPPPRYCWPPAGA